MYKTICILSFISILYGCALHPPISEEIIFSDNKSDKFLKTSEVFTAFSKSYYSSDFEKKALAQIGPKPDSTLNPNWQVGFSLYGFAFHFGENFALGISPGAIIVGSGLDATIRFSGRNFITFSGNLYWNYEAIIQRRVYYNGNYGLSIGSFFRRENQEFGQSTPIRRDSLISLNIIGIRSLCYVNFKKITLTGFISLGMEMKYKTPTLHFGISY